MHLGTFDGENDQLQWSVNKSMDRNPKFCRYRNEKKFSESQKSLFDELRGLQKSNSAANLATTSGSDL
ncbi:predicted protein [Plenodomus lingam JN3]|uniref:Predicted protein n=1 Tax=Leptosphaeria maculans (strain JN3 / isolate v23.1.3 / race Av1-4-5-6-7-8) TaxID=985895 RepID=E5R4D1_LEPMJ|nr:predicted protein [Plenodomus lingam JN3]CBX91899.1 predicted protein [Plenodomus lingam JN3]